ncbi:MAG: competence/damage-inducible protein A [Acidimicrobiia bacterium]|nr:competence/damage-inducible protein A [bacterium]MXW59985.1 competence/damage-inducible protein A [Acidimicrobiia bacterium]MXZ77426.1 competence/damage-inducible protein A [Acidimicrobiia bacterium]MYB73451.1 competence/damage-inducible protein A [Acidimicrobiia bacterium]MYE73892.1 competence/damage-inducible protein A [Acidimicrobiia bacterium]
MNCEVIAVGTELLLGQIVDTNSSWIGEQLALAGIDSHHQVKVGDNFDRMQAVLNQALDRSDSVIMCGGLGPTQDDITRDVIAAALGVELVRRDDIVERISRVFGGRGRAMPENNLRQADVPDGAEVLPVMPGTAPGFKVETGGKAVYAVPGVPWEMQQMVGECVLPDLKQRAGITAVIKSRTLRTWGDSESGLAEKLHEEIERLDETGECTIAFLASGMEGLKVRLTAKAPSEAEVDEILANEDQIVRGIIGDIVFGVDDETMESAVLDALRQRGWTLALAESLTGGLIGSRLTAVPGASDVFRGGLVSYASDVKFDLLDVPEGPVVSEEAVTAMARGAAKLLGADCAIAVTGVAGPDPLDGEDPGTVWMATLVKGEVEATKVKFPFDRERTRQFTTVSILNNLRMRVLAGK